MQHSFFVHRSTLLAWESIGQLVEIFQENSSTNTSHAVINIKDNSLGSRDVKNKMC